MLVMMYFAVPGAPKNFTLLSISARSAIVTWKEPLEPNGIIVGYIVFVISANYKLAQPVEDSFSPHVSVTGNETFYLPTSNLSLHLTDLHAYCEYRIKIQAQTSIGAGSESWLLLETPQDSKQFALMNIYIYIYKICIHIHTYILMFSSIWSGQKSCCEDRVHRHSHSSRQRVLAPSCVGRQKRCRDRLQTHLLHYRRYRTFDSPLRSV